MSTATRSTTRLALLTALTLTAFAANSLLCRAALHVEGMDAASFTFIRFFSAAILLGGLLAARGRGRAALAQGAWSTGVVLVVYGVLFSLAYRSIPAGVGALVLFGTTQLTMLGAAVRAGGGPRGVGWFGVAMAFGGLVALTLPGTSAPDLGGVLLMAASGVAWGAYSLRGRGVTHPTEVTAANFVFASVIALPVCAALAFFLPVSISPRGLGIALVCGVLTTGLGYVLWYSVIPDLGTTRASILQLAIPVIASAAGATFLSEVVTTRLVLASAVILGGIALVLRTGRRQPPRR